MGTILRVLSSRKSVTLFAYLGLLLLTYAYVRFFASIFSPILVLFIFAVNFTLIIILQFADRWTPGAISPNTMIQVNATIIAGIFIFLTLTSSQSIVHVGVIPVNPKGLIIGLATLDSIPFAISSIVIVGWGKQDKDVLEPVSGRALGGAYMVTGFAWIIITMIVLLLEAFSGNL